MRGSPSNSQWNTGIPEAFSALVSETPFLIRRKTPADNAACVASLRLVHQADGYPSSWPADPIGWLTPRGLIAAWLASSGPVAIGHMALGTIDPQTDPHIAEAAGRRADELAEIKRLFVIPSARGAGVAAALLDAAARYAIALGLHPVLEATADRDAAIRLYERHGWRRIGTSVATWARASGERPILHQYEPLPSTFD
jgi:GNAT superfamily N-acetyltransferase